MGYGETTSPREEEVGKQVVDAAYHVHKALGPGLLESVYEACMAQELAGRGMRVRRQVPVPVTYRGITLDEGYRIDLLVEDLVILEVKAVQEMHPIFRQQARTYLRLMNLQLGYLINFNVPLIREGTERIICTRPSSS